MKKKNSRFAVIFVSIFSVVTVAFLAIFAYIQIRNPACGANTDISKLFCKNLKEDSNNDPVAKFNNYVKFLDYSQTLYDKQNAQNSLQPLFSNLKIIPGEFGFAIPELLKLLPSDFGQNPITPYGILNFSIQFLPCISDLKSYCNYLINQSAPDLPGGVIGEFCKYYFENVKKKYNVENCPFLINQENPNVFIQDVGFFNQLGSLGSFSMNLDQVIVLKIKIPAKDLNLFYWSMNLYVSETFTPDDICYPTQQINFASVCAPFNNYRCSGISSKSPFDNVEGIVTISLCQQSLDIILDRLKDLDLDFQYDFKVPTAPNSFPIQKNLQNPNNLVSKNPYFDYKTQRLAVLFRMNDYPKSDSTLLENYIYQRNRNDFEMFMVELDSNESQTQGLYPFTPFPQIVLPPVNEFKTVQKTFRNSLSNLNEMFCNNYFFVNNLSTRMNIVAITAPLYKNIIANTNIPYKGGYQALQLAGNMQGDNRDAQYRSSQAVCLAENKNEALIGVFVNHSLLKNCFYNSVSVTDLNKALGYDSFTFTINQEIDPNLDQTVIFVLVGRNKTFLNFLEKEIEKQNKSSFVKQIHIETGSNENFKIPENHQVLLVERSYLNTNFEKDDKTYNYFDFFSIDENDNVKLKSDVDLDRLKNITAPDLSYFLPPVFYKVRQDQVILTYLVVGFVVLFVLAILICIFQHFETIKRVVVSAPFFAFHF